MEGYKNRTWPRTVVLASHFTTAELSTVKNFHTLKTRLDLVQGSSYASARQPFTANCYDKSKPVGKHMDGQVVTVINRSEIVGRPLAASKCPI